jgi:hypothetical protein
MRFAKSFIATPAHASLVLRMRACHVASLASRGALASHVLVCACECVMRRLWPLQALAGMHFSRWRGVLRMHK